MRELTLNINFNDYVGGDEEVTMEVDDDATNDEIIAMADEMFKNYVLENCSYEVYNEDGDVITD